MKKNITIIVLSILVQSAGKEHTPLKLTQPDMVIPLELQAYALVPTYSSEIKFPGIYNDSFRLKLSTGFLEKQEDEENYLWHPLTGYDNTSCVCKCNVPFLAVEKSFRSVASGMYLGNFSTDSRDYTSLSFTDSVKSIDRFGVGLNGALWLKSTSTYFKGISFWGEGVFKHRTAHIAQTDDWKRIHTHYYYKRKMGIGLITGTFSFFEGQYSIVKIGYGKDIVSINERQLDTLLFSVENLLYSTELIDSSVDNSFNCIEIGHIVNKKKINYGISAGVDRTNSDYENIDSDSSRAFIKGFFANEFRLNRLLVYTGVDFQYGVTLFNKSKHRVSYMNLIHEYSLNKAFHCINISIPAFGVVNVNEKVGVMIGCTMMYSYMRSNYNLKAGLTNEAIKSSVDFVLYPLNIQYAPSSKVMISINPKIDNSLLIGGLQISYEL
jgi:hypothetical protein